MHDQPLSSKSIENYGKENARKTTIFSSGVIVFVNLR